MPSNRQRPDRIESSHKFGSDASDALMVGAKIKPNSINPARANTLSRVDANCPKHKVICHPLIF